MADGLNLFIQHMYFEHLLAEPVLRMFYEELYRKRPRYQRVKGNPEDCGSERSEFTFQPACSLA